MMPNEPTRVKRGRFTYTMDVELVTCTLGEPDNPESEFVFSLHHLYLPEVIAGLQAIVRAKKRGQRIKKAGER